MAQLKKPRILMVEDEPAILRANASYFKAQGYEVVAAGSLASARAAMQELPPDLVLLDVMLGDGSGFDFCREIREQSSAPILYLTALGAPEDEERGFALGGDDYVVKPYQLNILAARVAALLRRTGVSSGGAVKLSQMELRLLYYFMENFGRRLDRDAIYESVWGLPALEGSHTVKEHVYRLRKKLDMAGPDSYSQITAEGKTYLFGKVRY